jgi:hypothetical protein
MEFRDGKVAHETQYLPTRSSHLPDDLSGSSTRRNKTPLCAVGLCGIKMITHPWLCHDPVLQTQAKERKRKAQLRWAFSMGSFSCATWRSPCVFPRPQGSSFLHSVHACQEPVGRGSRLLHRDPALHTILPDKQTLWLATDDSNLAPAQRRPQPGEEEIAPIGDIPEGHGGFFLTQTQSLRRHVKELAQLLQIKSVGNGRPSLPAH